jgi:hypothetical protein
MRIAAAALATFTALLLGMTAAQARCSLQKFSFPFGEPGASGNTTMTVSDGGPCNIKLREASTSVFKSISVITRPNHGSVRAPNPANVTYTPRAGFQGQDNFVFSVSGTKNGVRSSARIAVSVSVEGGGAPAMLSSNEPRPAKTRASRASARQAAAPTGLRMQCLKQAGASIDPVTKRWTFYMTERDGASRTDMFRLCLAGGDRAKARTIVVPETTRK